MRTENKVFIKSGLIAGFVFATIMAGFDYFDGSEFREYRFLLNVLFQGVFMGYLARYNHKKQLEKELEGDKDE